MNDNYIARKRATTPSRSLQVSNGHDGETLLVGDDGHRGAVIRRWGHLPDLQGDRYGSMGEEETTVSRQRHGFDDMTSPGGHLFSSPLYPPPPSCRGPTLDPPRCRRCADASSGIWFLPRTLSAPEARLASRLRAPFLQRYCSRALCCSALPAALRHTGMSDGRTRFLETC